MRSPRAIKLHYVRAYNLAAARYCQLAVNPITKLVI